MKNGRVLLSVKRNKQLPGECAIAAAATLASFYDESISYDEVRDLVPRKVRVDGLHTSQEARLLNQLGCGKVTIVTADLEIIDFSWADLPKSALIQKMKQLRAYYGRARRDSKEVVDDMIDWLETEGCDNQLKIDQDFPKYIRRYINNGRPVGASFNWTSLHKFTKRGESVNDDIKGESEYHAVVIRGYDEDGVFVVDSHSKHYRGRWKKYKNGFYKVRWEKFLVNAHSGDLILVG